MKFLICGDSWAYGADVKHPDHIDRNYKVADPLFVINDEYRKNNRFMKQIADKMGYDTIIDLSYQGGSNDLIVRRLTNWLVKNDYTNGKDTDDLFVCITWTSPERTEFQSFNNTMPSFAHDGYIAVGPWSVAVGYEHDKEINDFFHTFHKYFWNKNEMCNRFLYLVWHTQNLLKQHNIKYVMTQTFVDNDYAWSKKDRNVQEFISSLPIDDNCPRQKLWNNIDDIKFMNKNDTLVLFLNRISTELIMEKNAHPILEGHKLIADHIYNYIKENQIV